jgi:hypothetical protein
VAKKNKPLWTVSEWISDKDKRTEVLLTLLIVLLVAVLLVQSLGGR